MAEKTTNYGLTKPYPDEFYDVGVQNANMDVIDEALQKLSEDSGVIIGADEPDEGEVWIDTDEGDYEDETIVTSVNNKMGDVILSASDVGAAPVIQWGTTDVTAGSASSYPNGTLYVVVE